MKENQTKIGYILAFSSYLLWGFLPIYWKQLKHFASMEILGVRILLSVLTLLIVIHVFRKPVYLDYLKNPMLRRKLILSAVLIAVNWGVFLFAVGTGKVLQASLGYFINPLVSMFLGVLILKEKLSRSQKVSIGFASLGVIYMTLFYGVFPWISIVLAFSFGFYGLLKKIAGLDSLNSLLVEVLILSPLAIGIILYQNLVIGSDMFLSGGLEWGFIFFAGIITVIPLIMFAEGVKRIPLSAIGFLQYLVPTIMFVLGVVFYDETFTLQQGISFGLIWIGVVVYLVSIGYRQKKMQKN